MEIGQKICLIDYSFVNFNLFFIENPGMAFGLSIMPKSMLTILRIVVVIIGIKYLYSLKKNNFPVGSLICIGLLLGGAIGNIIDSVFYGVIFSDSYNNIASFLADSGGYGGWLQGRVVDMFSFHFFTIDLPEWLAIPIPFSETTILNILEGYDGLFTFFAPVFNIADAAISVGVTCLLIFYRKLF